MPDRDIDSLTVLQTGNLRYASVFADQLHGFGIEMDFPAALFNRTLKRVPHHPRSLSRIIKFIRQRLCIAGTEKGIGQGSLQRQAFNALRSPIGPDHVAGNPPHFFRVGLEKSFVKFLAEPINYPLFKGIFFGERPDLSPQVTEQDQYAFENSQLEQDIKHIYGILEKTAPKVNA